jgi:DNA-binding XRE family transcriptional regulator
MDKAKLKRLADAGWAVGDVQEFLDLSDEEVALIETRLALAATVREKRKQLRLTQQDLAKRLSSSQSRVAKLEASDPTVSLDLLIKALIALGLSRAELAKAIRRPLPKASPS